MAARPWLHRRRCSTIKEVFLTEFSGELGGSPGEIAPIEPAANTKRLESHRERRDSPGEAGKARSVRHGGRIVCQVDGKSRYSAASSGRKAASCERTCSPTIFRWHTTCTFPLPKLAVSPLPSSGSAKG